MEHTKTPWEYDKYGQLNGPDGKVITTWGLGLAMGQRTPETEGNAKFIVRSVNAFESMKAALEALLEVTPQELCTQDCDEDNCPWKQAQAALNLADKENGL